jgi:hypothetical protein
MIDFPKRNPVSLVKSPRGSLHNEERKERGEKRGLFPLSSILFPLFSFLFSFLGLLDVFPAPINLNYS